MRWEGKTQGEPRVEIFGYGGTGAGRKGRWMKVKVEGYSRRAGT